MHNSDPAQPMQRLNRRRWRRHHAIFLAGRRFDRLRLRCVRFRFVGMAHDAQRADSTLGANVSPRRSAAGVFQTVHHRREHRRIGQPLQANAFGGEFLLVSEKRVTGVRLVKRQELL